MRNGGKLFEKLDDIDMEDFLSYAGVTFKMTTGSSGRQINIKECPACGTSKWKVYMNAASGLGNCFSGSCPKGTFNKFSFLQELYGDTKSMSFEVDQYCRDIGWRPKKEEATVRYSGDFELPPTEEMVEGSEGYEYVVRRGISPELIDYFGWRYCRDGVFTPTGDDGYTQWFGKRIIIPVYDIGGELVSFQGRDVTGKAKQKYLFPRGLKSTGSFLYNADQSVGSKKIVIGEGVMDVAAIKTAMDMHSIRGIGAVASFGKSLSMGASDTDQLYSLIRLKEKGLETVLFMWDGESKALSDALKTAIKLKGYEFNVAVCVLPDGKDPNEAPPDVVVGLLNTKPQSVMEMMKMLAKLRVAA